jgi:hypothetical protein
MGCVFSSNLIVNRIMIQTNWIPTRQHSGIAWNDGVPLPLPFDNNKDANEMLPSSSISIALCIAFLIDNNQDSHRMRASSSIPHFIRFLM